MEGFSVHKVIYENAPSGWNEALPLGNGHFGGMVYFEDNRLTMAMNHYEVYYKKLHRYSHKSRSGTGRDYSKQAGMTFGELKRLTADKYRDPAQDSYFSYRESLGYSWNETRYGKPAGGSSHYPTGEIQLLLDGKLAEADHYSLRLDVEQASVGLRIENGDDKLETRTIVTRESDYIVTEVGQTDSGLLDAVYMTLPVRKYQNLSASYYQLDDTTFYYTGSFYPDGEDRDKYGPFTFLVMTKLAGAKGSAEIAEEGMTIRLREAEKSVVLITTVVTEEETSELLETASSRLDEAESNVWGLIDRHRDHWADFWKRSSVTLPDKMLEDLWYVNLYAIACSSGKGGRMFEQACGLNGLWDIKQPTKWGSMWYWDVNIQAAFWPLYTANHLEVAEAFHDALLTYTDSAEKMAKQFYGLDGFAGDYPHVLYLSIWPWCAQFCWHYYQYSMDTDFLKEKAYPLFRSILRFFEGYLQYDADKGQYFVYPDISPEQGPLTRNSTITLATVKYLLQIAIEANTLLGEAEGDRNKWAELAEKLAPYPTGVSGTYGDVILDSEWAPEDLHLRHPSILMPIYPIGEIDKNSGEALRRRAENTLRYVEEHTETGVFQFGWLSCAASRLGKGNTAIRLLYEQGIDLSLRSNGLFAEETERWVNYCNITNEPLYYPHVMEASGETVAAINEMLLQSYDGVIDVFPAIPNGEPEHERGIGMKKEDAARMHRQYGGWDDCEFQGLLAVGAFEVSAVRKDGRTVRVGITSLAGKQTVVRHPFASGGTVSVVRLDGAYPVPAEHRTEGGRIVFETVKGGEYWIVPVSASHDAETSAADPAALPSDPAVYPRVHEAHTHRRVFLGKNRDTRHIQLLDHFTFDYYSGNYRESRTAVYRLDFGASGERPAKDYAKALPKQFHMDGVLGQDFRRVTPETAFTSFRGLGWESAEDLIAEERGGPDELRKDFIGGTGERSFWLELPKGRYDVLFVSGDADAPSYTEIEIDGQGAGWKPERELAAGEFATDILAVAQRKDGFAKIRFRSREGMQWRINVLIVNKNYTYF
jgi:hypothetical protein